jgi:hypothetical protein
VCSSWRQIVIKLPRLWAAGLVDVRLDRRNARKHHLDGLQTLLNRSAPLPIEVALTNKMESMDPHAPSIAAILRIIAPTVSRWKCLTLDSISFHAFKETSPGPFTALETLNMRYNPEL